MKILNFTTTVNQGATVVQQFAINSNFLVNSPVDATIHFINVQVYSANALLQEWEAQINFLDNSGNPIPGGVTSSVNAGGGVSASVNSNVLMLFSRMSPTLYFNQDLNYNIYGIQLTSLIAQFFSAPPGAGVINITLNVGLDL